jgi:type II secretory pathway pseudopilin PulG
VSAVPAPARSADAGFSILETLVAMVVGMVVMGAATTMFTASLRANTTTTARVEATNTARVAIAEVSRTLRTAIRPVQLGDLASTEPAVLEATGTRLRFYANIDNATEAVGPTRVTYDMSGGTLVQTLQRPTMPVSPATAFTYCDDTLPSCPVQRSVLASGLKATSAFSYVATDGTTLAAPATGMTAASRALVNGVDVSIALTGSGTSGATTVLTRVQLVNQDAYRMGKS